MKTNAKHTVGPWEVIDQGKIEGISFGNLDLKSICRVIEGTKHVLAEMCLPADAVLMSAAPDMLKALEACVELLGDSEKWGHIPSTAKIEAMEAIAKARGEA